LAGVGIGAPEAVGQPFFKNSIVSTDFDFITAADPTAFVKLTSKGRAVREMPDKRPGSGELRKTAFVFEATFSDGTMVELDLSLDFATDEAALQEAQRYTGPLGKLPTALRKGVKRVVVQKGGANVSASSDVGLIMLYSDNAAKRISTHDLEETVFHESVHASWDKAHAKSEGWIRAQIADGGYLTDYAKRLPTREDLAESALFAYTLTHHPERIPEETAKKIRAAIPNRIAYVAALIPKDKPIFYPVSQRPATTKSVGNTASLVDAVAQRAEPLD
jgi:hypothetical protein